MTETTVPPRSAPAPPTQASPPRRVAHLLVALAGWVLFVYWWFLVLGRVSLEEVRLTGLFIVLTLLVTVMLTVAWSFHNLRIWKRRGPRLRVREAADAFAHDRLGRDLVTEGPPEGLKRDALIVVRIEPGQKTYQLASNPGGGGASNPWAPVPGSRR